MRISTTNIFFFPQYPRSAMPILLVENADLSRVTIVDRRFEELVPLQEIRKHFIYK
jgi:hypothetical protein